MCECVSEMSTNSGPFQLPSANEKEKTQQKTGKKEYLSKEYSSASRIHVHLSATHEHSMHIAHAHQAAATASSSQIIAKGSNGRTTAMKGALFKKSTALHSKSGLHRARTHRNQNIANSSNYNRLIESRFSISNSAYRIDRMHG